MRAAATLLWIVCLAPSARAVDGVLQINQACATGAGCFPGDSAGLPVQIQFAGSYRLTSNLVAASADSTMILVQTPYVSVDLNGFAIEGPNTFTGPGGVCTAPGTGIGISGVSSDLAISNGYVRGMGSHGIQLNQNGNNYRIHGVVAEQNCGDGIRVGNNSLVVDSLARRNAGSGIVGTTRNQVRNSVAESNKGSGIFDAGSAGRWLVQGSTANGNGANGIDLHLNNGSLVMDCSATNSAQTGILMGGNSLVLRSVANGNLQGVSASASGIGFITANQNGSDVVGAPALVACNVVGGGQFCP